MFKVRDYIKAANEYRLWVTKDFEKKFEQCRKELMINLRGYKNIALYGGGGHTSDLLLFLKENNFETEKIKCVIDPKSTNQKIDGYSVVTLSEAVSKYELDAIVVSSFNYEIIIYNRLLEEMLDGIDIIRIYEMEEFCPERSYAEYDESGILRSNIPMDHLQRYGWAVGLCIGKDVVDMACGCGYGTAWISDYAKNVVGIDISEDAIHFANKHYKKDNCSFICSDILNVSIDKKYDVVVSFETIEHIEDDDAYFNSVKKLLKNDGVLVVSTPIALDDSRISGSNVFHINEYTVDRFVTTLNKHFNKIIWYRQDECSDFTVSIDDGNYEPSKKGATIMLAVCIMGD